jgi:hypothetical protein
MYLTRLFDKAIGVFAMFDESTVSAYWELAGVAKEPENFIWMIGATVLMLITGSSSGRWSRRGGRRRSNGRCGSNSD